MSASKEYKKLKRLYHEEQLNVKSVHIEISPRDDEQQGEIIFEEQDGSERKVTGDSDDFIHALFNIKKTVKEDGEEKFVDLESQTVGGTDGYYSNMDFFLEHTNSEEDVIGYSIKKLHETGVEIEGEFNLQSALIASIEDDFHNDNLLTLVRNYYDAVGLKALEAKKGADYCQGTIPKRSDVFEEVYMEVEGILKEAYPPKSPKKSYREFHEITETDIDYLAESLSELRERTKTEWQSLTNDRESGVGLELGIKRVLDNYANHFELIREPIRDLAHSCNKDNPKKPDKLSDQIRSLEETSADKLPELVDEYDELRHGSSHVSAQVDAENELVKIYNNRGKSRYVKETYDCEEVVEITNEFRDAVEGVLYAFLLTKEMLELLYITSPEFKFHVIDNMDPDILGEN